MNYIFITFGGMCLPIAEKLQKEGHEVIVGIIDDIKDYVMEEEMRGAKENDIDRKRRLSLYRNILDIQPADKVVEKMKTIKNPHEYFVFFEENDLYRWSAKVIDMGFEGNFPTKEDYLFETDRDNAKEFVRKHYPKLNIPEVKEFTKAADAIKFLEKTEDIWVLKGRDVTANTFVPDISDIELAKRQVIEMLNNFPKIYEEMGFILELFIPNAIELTPEKLYYDGVPIATTLDIENKSFGSGNKSIQTGCAEDLVFPTNMEDRINKLAFPEIVDEMAREHKGLFIWDASLLINKRDGKIYFGEFCSNRPGYNALFTELAQCSSIDTYFDNIVHKKSPFNPGTVASSVRIFNMNEDPKSDNVASDMTVDYKPEIEKDLWLWDVKKNDRGTLVTVGLDWNLAVITGSGKSVEEAVSRMYRNIDGLSFVGAYYRPKDDYVSLDYQTSIINRLNYGVERGLYQLPFTVIVGEIK